jgi:hypothetical protein
MQSPVAIVTVEELRLTDKGRQAKNFWQPKTTAQAVRLGGGCGGSSAGNEGCRLAVKREWDG